MPAEHMGGVPLTLTPMQTRAVPPLLPAEQLTLTPLHMVAMATPSTRSNTAGAMRLWPQALLLLQLLLLQLGKPAYMHSLGRQNGGNSRGKSRVRGRGSRSGCSRGNSASSGQGAGGRGPSGASAT